MLIKHKFLDKYPIEGKKILIIGTFNPDTICNPAKFFYGRSKNYFWTLLPKTLKQESLQKSSPEERIAFLQRNQIELTDLVYSAILTEDEIGDYSDATLDKNIKDWNTDNIKKALEKGETKCVFFTRKTFSGVPNIKKRIMEIEDFCKKRQIKFCLLPTPARFTNRTKMTEWEENFKCLEELDK
jgi:G:T/U-mismatch repair DNA glycosylase